MEVNPTATDPGGDIRRRIGDVAETLLEYCESNTTFQAKSVATIPAKSYTDPILWRAELDVVFRRLPMMLALTCELPKPGDYKATEIAGVPVLIVRDEAGVARSFINACAHRWTPVAPEGYGKCSRFRFFCPFHGWTYGTDGTLMAVADRSKFGDIDRSMRGLRPLPCEERYGMIFVCLTPGIPLELEAYYGALVEEFADANLERSVLLGSKVLEGPNWKLILANFFESYHIGTLHAKTVTDFISDVNHYEAFGPNLRIGFAKRGIAKLRELPRAQWGQAEGEGFSFMRYFFPNVIGSIGLYLGEISAFLQLYPGPTPDRTRLVVLYVCKGEPADEVSRADLAEKLRSLKQAHDAVLGEEDFANGFVTQRGLESGAHEGLLYGRNEAGSHHLHAWLDWYLKSDPRAPRPQL